MKELFPVYPLNLVSPPKSRTKFGTRSIYVDLPPQAYYFMQLMMGKATEADLTTEEVREEWLKFLQHYKTFLIFREKPLVFVSLRRDKTGKKFFMLNVRWDLFIEYLEEKAKGFVSDVERDGRNVMKVYKEIWTNFFSVRGEMIPPEPRYFPSTREKFRKLLKRTGDYSYLIGLLSQFEEMIKLIGEMTKNEVPSIQLYTTNLIMDIQHLHTLIDTIDIPAAYLLLRNILENFIKLFVYLDVGKSFDPNLVLSVMFLYEYETVGKFDFKSRRKYSLKGFKDEFIRKLLKISSALSSDETLNLFDLVNKLKEKQVPTLGVNPKLLEAFSESYGLDEINLNVLYSACSGIIHNQPPLPFFSLLEIKFFKHFLEKYVHSLRAVAEKLINEKIELKKIFPSSLSQEKLLLKKSLRTAYLLERKYEEEIESIIRRAATTLQREQPEIWIKPLTLISLFYLISPSRRRLRDFSFVEEDLKDIIKKIQPLSFKISIQDEIEDTLNKLQEMLLPELERYSMFASLESMEQKRKVIFYLLLHYLPLVIEEVKTL